MTSALFIELSLIAVYQERVRVLDQKHGMKLSDRTGQYRTNCAGLSFDGARFICVEIPQYNFSERGQALYVSLFYKLMYHDLMILMSKTMSLIFFHLSI